MPTNQVRPDPPPAPPRKRETLMVVGRETLVRKIDARLEELIQAKEKALDSGLSIRAGQLEKQLAELRWVVDVIAEID